MKAVVFRGQTQELEMFTTTEATLFISVGSIGEFNQEAVELDVYDVKEMIKELRRFVKEMENE